MGDAVRGAQRKNKPLDRSSEAAISKARKNIRKGLFEAAIEAANPETKKRRLEALQPWSESELNVGSALPKEK